jgi:hypothetical protein
MPSHEETACLHSSLSPHPWESSHLFCLARKAEKQIFFIYEYLHESCEP